MGLSIHYRGKLRDAGTIKALTEEIADIADVMDWRQHSIADSSCEGIIVSPEKCEPIVLTFLQDGTLISAPLMKYGVKPGDYIFTKTQYAGVEVHMVVIRLLRYLKDKYFETFELIDEGNYWETGDEAILREQFAAYDRALAAVNDALAGFKAVKGEKMEGMVDRLEEWLKRRLK